MPSGGPRGSPFFVPIRYGTQSSRRRNHRIACLGTPSSRQQGRRGSCCATRVELGLPGQEGSYTSPRHGPRALLWAERSCCRCSSAWGLLRGNCRVPSEVNQLVCPIPSIGRQWILSQPCLRKAHCWPLGLGLEPRSPLARGRRRVRKLGPGNDLREGFLWPPLEELGAAGEPPHGPSKSLSSPATSPEP